MKINQIISETTTAGAVAPVSQSFVKMKTRNPVVSSKQGNNLLTGKATNKKYANSVNESKMKDLAMDLTSGPDGLTDEEFKKKYGKTKQEMRKAMKDSSKEAKKPEPVAEADLHEEDKIIAVGKGHKLKPGLLDKPENSMNPTDTVKIDIPLLIRLLEFAREDANTDMDLHDLAEKLVDRGRRGKTLTMKDYDFVVEDREEIRDKEGKLVSWKDETPWHKSEKNKQGKAKDPRGVVTHLSDVARRETEKLGKVKEGAKVDRMVKHIKQSEIKAGKSADKAEDIAWATVNKRGYLDNKNKKKGK